MNVPTEKQFRIIAISDTHGNTETLERILPEISKCDYVFHLGDGGDDLVRCSPSFNAYTVCVRGNCDFYSNRPYEEIVKIGNINFFLTHGHRLGVKNSYTSLALKAKLEGCSFALFGHTHSAYLKELCGVHIVNPGSLSYPRSGLPSYALITGGGNRFFTKIVTL